MSRLAWDVVGERLYKTGVDRGVLYVEGSDGVAWNGLTQVDENPSGAEPKGFYFDGVMYYHARSSEEFQGTINAFFSPPEFDVCDGTLSLATGIFATQQKRRPFGLCYRTKIGNDVEGEDHGYEIHLIYNALAAPTNKQYRSLGAEPTTTILSWSFITKPMSIPGGRPSAHLVLDSTKLDPEILAQLEDVLYGTDDSPATMLSVQELLGLLDERFIDGGAPTEMFPVVYDGVSPSSIPTIILDGGAP